MKFKKLGFALSTFAALSVIPVSVLTMELSQPSIVVAQDTQPTRLNGVWNCDIGGVFFIRQVGDQMWWYGESVDGAHSWTNVFQGSIDGNQVIGSWVDVPKGRNRGYGEMTLSISGNRIKKIAGGENFGCNVWRR